MGEDDVVRVAKAEVRKVEGTFVMNERSALYIVKNMPTYSFGSRSRSRMQALYRDAVEVLSKGDEANSEEHIEEGENEPRPSHKCST